MFVKKTKNKKQQKNTTKKQENNNKHTHNKNKQKQQQTNKQTKHVDTFEAIFPVTICKTVIMYLIKA